MIRKFIFAVILGIACAIIFNEHDAWTFKHAQDSFTTFFSRNYNCSVTMQVTSLSLLRPTLCCTNVVVTAPDGCWQWTASQFTIGFSWWKFLMYGVIDLFIYIDDLAIKVPSLGAFEQLQEHVSLIFKPRQSTFVCTLDEISIPHVSFDFEDATIKGLQHARMSYTMRSINGVLRCLLTIFDGSCTIDRNLAKNIQGTVLMDFPSSSSGTDYEITGQCSCTLPQLPAQQADCFVRGHWSQGTGTCSLMNAERTFVIDPIILKKTNDGFEVQTSMKTSAQQIAALVGIENTHLFSGTVAIEATVTSNKDTYDAMATCIGRDCAYADKSIGTCTLSCKKVAHLTEGELAIISDSTPYGAISWNYNLITKCGSLHACNGARFLLPLAPVWASDARDCVFDATWDASGVINGVYSMAMHHIYKKDTISSSGTCTIERGKGHLDGRCGTAHYTADFITNWPYVCSFVCSNDTCKTLLKLETTSSAGRLNNAPSIKGVIELDFLHALIGSLYGYNLQGTGTVHIDARYDSCLKASIKLQQGTILIPHIYNGITGMHGHLMYDWATRTLTIVNLECMLHKGNIKIDHGVCSHDANTITHWYIPLLFKNCLATFNRTLFASISGQLTASHSGGRSHIKGALLLDKSHIKENIFSDAFQKRIANISPALLVAESDVACDVTVDTIAPLKVDTPFLKADARMSSTMSNTARDPHIEGELIVESGSLLFPYRPLHITKGTITMTAANPDDPLIELVAQNQVRNYAITMHVTGSLLQHHLMFESTPTLTEQQIIALLLVGSEQESLNIVMPTLIMTNLVSLVFGSLRSESMVERCFKRFIKPLKEIRIIPRFSDQTSRGGIRGAIDIEVNDRWRAAIQKNFKLSEDTRFELEYQASDDIRVRAIRDEHRDMGAEVEMRWKF